MRKNLANKQEEQDFNSLRVVTVARIQAFILRFICKSRCTYLRSLVKTQSRVRGFIQRKRTQHLNRATLRLQKGVRAYFYSKNKRQVRRLTNFQSLVRGMLQRKKFLRIKTNLPKLQCLLRRKIAQTFASELQHKDKIRRVIQGFLVRRQAAIKKSGYRIAKLFKRFLARRFFKHEKSARVISCVFRAFLKKQKIPSANSVSVIFPESNQSSLNNIRYASREEKQSGSIEKIRSSSNSRKLGSNYFKNVLSSVYTARKGSVMALSADRYYDEYEPVYSYSPEVQFSQKEAAIRIQAFCRARIVRRQYLAARNATAVIQKWYRWIKKRRMYVQIKTVVSYLQTFWRMRQIRRRISNKKNGVHSSRRNW